MTSDPRDRSANDFRPSADLSTLRTRAELTRHLREVFHRAGFWEVETPILADAAVIDAHIDPPAVRFDDGSTRYLQTSPEYGMKRLLAAGADAIYQLGKVVRGSESGRLHNPEFTMVEWYRLGDNHHAAMDFVEELVRSVVARGIELGSEAAPDLLPTAPFERLSYRHAFRGAIGIDPLTAEPSELIKLLDGTGGIGIAADKPIDRDDLLNLLLIKRVEPWLTKRRAVFLHDYPASQAALAKTRPPEPGEEQHAGTADRFELYLRGVELCNGYRELTDPDELLRRQRIENARRTDRDAKPLPEKHRLLDAMRHGLPECAGVALGWDRLVMLITGKTAIAEVIAFEWDRA